MNRAEQLSEAYEAGAFAAANGDEECPYEDGDLADSWWEGFYDWS